MEHDEIYTFDSFLKKCIAKSDYMHEIQGTPKWRRILLKRKPIEILTNIFSRHIPLI